MKRRYPLNGQEEVNRNIFKVQNTFTDLKYRIAEWLEAHPLAQRVRGSIPLFGQNVKSGKPF